MSDIDNYRFHFCKTFDDVKLLVKYCKQTGWCCHDFETNGDSYIEPTSYPTILSISFQPYSAWVVPLAHKDSPLRDIYKEVLMYIGVELIENISIIKIAQNFKFEYKWWKKYGIIPNGVLLDTMLAKYLLNEERPHGLKEMVSMFIPEYDGYDLPNQPSDKAELPIVVEFWSNVPIMELSKYGSLDADLTFRLWIFFEQRIRDNGFYPLLRNLLMMSTRVLAEVEYNGMYTDRNYLSNLLKVYSKKLEDCEKSIRTLPEMVEYEDKRLSQIKRFWIKDIKNEIKQLKAKGASQKAIATKEQKLSRFIAGEVTTKKDKELLEPLNFNSPKQLSELFFYNDFGLNWEILEFTKNQKTKKSTNTPSLSEDTLLKYKTKYKHPILDHLMELRGLVKLNSTYVVGMWNKLHTDDRIHGSFLIHGTVTGRLSSRDPNLQNIPRDTTASDIKKMFIAPKGRLILQLDYSQAELRVLAFLANETTMMEWFNSGHDIHLATACKKYGVNYKEIEDILNDESNPDYKTWKIRRKQAKTTNFGIAYEQGKFALAEKFCEQGIDTTPDEAEEILKDWFDNFPKVKRYINKQHGIAKRQGFVKNLFGRKRRLQALLSSGNKWKEAEALRLSVNAPIQGTASDFALFSSVLIREEIIKGNLPSTLEQFGTVHDSIMYYIEPKDIHWVVPILSKICANPGTMEWFGFEIKGVEMKADFEVGKSWGDLVKYSKGEDYTKWV